MSADLEECVSQEVASLNSRFSERRAVLKRHAFRAGPYSERDDEMGNGAAAEEPEQTLEEVEKGSSIRVVAGDGINLQLNAKVDHSPALVYELLTDPTANDVFRSIQACTAREILEEDPRRGTRKLAISHRAITRFLFIRVTFETHLFVWEDDRERTIRFTTARQGFMQAFEGIWHVRPWTQHSLNQANSVPQAQPQPDTYPSWFNPGAVITAAQRMMPGAHNNASLVTLEQHIRTKQTPPAAIRHVIKNLVSKQIKDMMEDLRNELDRRERKRSEAAGQLTTGGTGKTAQQQEGARSKSALPFGTACVTGALPVDIWQHCDPLIDITIQI